jgi:hypothetical protein
VAEGWDKDGLRAVRGALHSQDWVALLAALQRGTVREVLQLAGDGVAGAAVRGLPGAAEMAALFIDALQERGFRGDEELADRLRAAMGDAAIPLLRPLAVDLEMLAMLLEADRAESGGRIDLSTGECWPAFTDELEAGAGVEEADDPDRWLYVPLWVPGPVTGTWSCTSTGSATSHSPTGCGSPSPGGAPSDASRTSSPGTSAPGAGTTGSAMSDSAAGPAPGWRRRAIALPRHAAHPRADRRDLARRRHRTAGFALTGRL